MGMYIAENLNRDKIITEVKRSHDKGAVLVIRKNQPVEITDQEMKFLLDSSIISKDLLKKVDAIETPAEVVAEVKPKMIKKPKSFTK